MRDIYIYIALYGQLSHSLLDVGAQRMRYIYIYCTIWTAISQSPRRWGTKDEIYIYCTVWTAISQSPRRWGTKDETGGILEKYFGARPIDRQK